MLTNPYLNHPATSPPPPQAPPSPCGMPAAVYLKEARRSPGAGYTGGNTPPDGTDVIAPASQRQKHEVGGLQSSAKAMVPKAQRLAHSAPLTRDCPPRSRNSIWIFGSFFVEIVDGESVICLLPVSLTEDIEVFISMTEPAGCGPRRKVFHSQRLS